MESLKSLINTSKSGNEVDARHQRCEEMREEAITKCPRVSFLVNIMEKMGCKMDAGFYSSVECVGQINGGFHLDEAGKPGVVLCQNHIQDQEWMDRTLAHELIHAYDHCRAKMDWNNCEQHACSEASLLFCLYLHAPTSQALDPAQRSMQGQMMFPFDRDAQRSDLQSPNFVQKQLNQGQSTTRKMTNAMAAADAPTVSSETIAETTTTITTTEATSEEGGVVHKKRRVERREKLRKTALCKHFDKPGGCPFPDCRSEVKDGGMLTIVAQRKLIREQTIARNEGKFLGSKTASPASLRGTMIERYYTELFSCDMMDKKMEDQYVHMHSNRLCVVGVASSHPVMKEEIEAVEFSPNVLDNKVSGKKKKGGQFMVPTTILCQIKCKSGASYAIRSCIRGALLEVNEKLLERPQLLQEKPKQVEVAEIQESLLSKDEYFQYRSIVAAADDASVKQEEGPDADASGETEATPMEQDPEPASSTPLDQ
ncbi:Peptidase, partial [Globisporangium splendens]